jgi:hypothetical protein
MGWSVPFSLGEFLVEGPLLAPQSPVDPLLSAAIPKARHSEREKRMSAETSGQVDWCGVASPGTGNPTLRQNAAKRGSSLKRWMKGS